MNYHTDITLRGVRSPLRDLGGEQFTNTDEQEQIKESFDLWKLGLTGLLTHWKLDLSLSQRHPVLDEWTMAIYGDPWEFKCRSVVDPSDDMMKIIGTGRDLDMIVTVHRAIFDERLLADTDLFSDGNQFYYIKSIDHTDQLKNHETMLVFACYKRNTPELAQGVNIPIITTPHAIP